MVETKIYYFSLGLNIVLFLAVIILAIFLGINVNEESDSGNAASSSSSDGDEDSLDINYASLTIDSGNDCTCSTTSLTTGCCLNASQFDDLVDYLNYSFTIADLYENYNPDTEPNVTDYYFLGNIAAAHDSTYDYVIIGAGVGGLYMAQALYNDDPTKSILIVERLNRVGGRTFSLQLDYTPDGPGTDVTNQIHLELGGMRFLPEHKRLLALLNYTQLCDDVEIFTSGQDDGENPYYLRRNRFTVSQGKNNSTYWTDTYNIKESEICASNSNHFPSCYFDAIWDEIRRYNNKDGYTASDATKWQHVRNHWVYNVHGVNKTLNNIAWNVLLRAMGFTNEAIDLMCDSNGFFSEFHQQVNAGDVLQEFVGDWGAINTFYTLKHGYDSTSRKLYDMLRNETSVKFLFETNVTSIERYGGSFYGVYLTDISAENYNETYLQIGKNVIITMDSINLQEQLSGFKPINTAKTRGMIFSVKQQRLSKINLVFDKEFGIDENIYYEGGSFTDMQIGSWYMIKAWRNDSNNHTFYDAVMYCDYYNANFWESLYDENDLYPFNHSLIKLGNSPYGDAYNLSNVLLASNTQVNMLLTLLNEQLNVTIPTPLAAFYSPWGTQTNFGGSTNLFTVGTNDSQLLDEIWQPEKSHQIYICGEAFSTVQAWIEGTLQSCNTLLDNLGIEYPYQDFQACSNLPSGDVCPNGHRLGKLQFMCAD